MRIFTGLTGLVVGLTACVILLVLSANAHTLVTPDNRVIMDLVALCLIIGIGFGFMMFAISLDDDTWTRRSRRARQRERDELRRLRITNRAHWRG